MKVKFFLIQIILVLLFVPTIVFGIEGTGNSQNTGVGTSPSNDYKWPGLSIGITDDKSIRGIRITLYEFSNNVATAKKSIEFFSRDDFKTYLEQHDVNFYTDMTSRLSHSKNQDTNISFGRITNERHVISDLPLFLEPDVMSVSDFFLPTGANFNKDKVFKFLEFFDDYDNNDLAQYYYVVEPTSFLIIAGKPIYGTAYEHAKFVKANNVYSQTWSNLRSHTYHQLPMSFYVGESSISNPDTANFNGFLNSFGASKVPNSFVTGCAATDEAEGCMNNDDVLTYTFGMGILWDRDFKDKRTETCDYTVNVNKCGNTGISEPNSDVCTIGKSSNFYSSYKDSGRIYCSHSISTNFTDFYNSFSSVKRVGSYFPMNNLTMNADMTCYIVKTNSSTDLSNWETIIDDKSGGDIYLTIGGRKYTLTSSHTNNNPVCVSSSNGVCDKATLSTTYTYSLNPLVNRFINIETMKEDVNQYQTSTNIDNGGPRLTVPINYKNGAYKYKLDLNNTLFGELKSEIFNSTVDVRRNGVDYILTYQTDKSLTDTDLIYNCPYKVTQDQCKDENGNLVPCPVDGCANLPEDKCCINGNIVDCPIECSGECCDSNGNEIECPGGESIIGGIIYRPISLTNPFPGIEGGGRLPGSNWDKIVTINGRTYSASDYYIKYNRGYNDYEVYQTEPLYVIKLDTNKIKAIREYNDYKDHNYNDFDLECDNGKNCISKFLRGRADHFSINLIDSGTCKNINPRTFDSCITRKN